METHAVPQEIMGVEFKLFGNFLSLREFVFIAVGLALAYFFYFLMQRGVLPGILAFPAILFFGLGGTLIGLVPIQERSLDKWIVNYFSAINRPTQRVWKKMGFTGQTASGSTDVVTKSHVVSPPPGIQTEVFAAGTGDTPKKADSATIEVEKGESQELQRINSVLSEIETGIPTKVSATPAPTTTASVTTPAPTQTPATSAPATITPPQPAQPQPSVTQVSIQPQVQLQSQAIPVQLAPSTPTSQVAQTTITSIPDSEPAMIQQATTQPTTNSANTSNPPAQPDPQTGQQPAQQKPPQKEEPTKEQQPNVLDIEDRNVKNYATTITGLTSKPNTINIVVKDAKGLILPGVVCVTKNPQGEPVRAAISNVLGQILNNVPLKNGTYHVSLTKQGYVFPEIVRTLKGKTYPPIEIKAL